MSVEFGTKAVACYDKGYHHHRLLRGVWSYKTSPLWGLPALIRPSPIWRVLNKLPCERLPNNEALQWAILSTQSLLRVVFCHNAVSVNFKHDIRGSKFTLIIETLKPVQSWMY